MSISEGGLTRSQSGLPPNGTTGQVLTKDSNASYDVSWETPTPPTPSSFISGKTVTNFAALPSAAANATLLAICLNSQGVWFVNYKAAGFYYSDGTNWLYQGDYTLTDEASEIGNTGFVSGAGTVSPSDFQLQVNNKLDGNIRTMLGNYQTLLIMQAPLTAAAGARTNMFSSSGTLMNVAVGQAVAPTAFYFRGADFSAVTGLTVNFRIALQVSTNDTAPASNFTPALYKLTSPTGGIGLVLYTWTLVTGSDGGVVTTPAANSINTVTSSNFTIGSDGLYAVGLTTSAPIAALAQVHLAAQLQIHQT